MRGQRLAIAGLAALMFLPGVAAATNGYFAHGYGTANKGLAGAGVALPQNALTIATNPAGLTRLGHRVDLGAALFSPWRDHSISGFPTDPSTLPPGSPPTFPLETGSYESGSEYFLIPHFGYNRPLDERSAIGIAAYGNGGMNTDWPGHANPIRLAGGGQGDNPENPGFNPCVPGAFPGTGTFCAGGAGVDLMQLFITPTYAREVSDSVSLGVTAVLAYQRFEATGLGTFAGFSTDMAKLSNNSHEDSYGAGIRIGLLASLSPTVDVGLSYQSKIWMSEFDDYAGLFAEDGGFDVPSNFTAGIAWKTSDRSVLVFDIQHIRFSEVDSVGNPFAYLATCGGFITGTPDPDYCLGGDKGTGFGWDDMTVYKLGYQWQTDGDWTWRVGWSYGKQPIPASEVLFNILAPAVVEHHITAGFSKKLASGSEIHFAVAYMPEESVSGPNPLDPAQEIKLEMDEFELELSWTWHLD